MGNHDTWAKFSALIFTCYDPVACNSLSRCSCFSPSIRLLYSYSLVYSVFRAVEVQNTIIQETTRQKENQVPLSFSESQSSFESTHSCLPPPLKEKKKDCILLTQIYFCSLHENKAKYSVCALAFWQTKVYVYNDWPVKIYI